MIPESVATVVLLGLAFWGLSAVGLLFGRRWRRGRTPRARWWVRTIPADQPRSHRHHMKEYVALCLVPCLSVCLAAVGVMVLAIFLGPYLGFVVILGACVTMVWAALYFETTTLPTYPLDLQRYPQWLRGEREAELRRLQDEGKVRRQV